MGHAGAIISGGKGDAKSKIACLESHGIRVVNNPAKMGIAMHELMTQQGNTAIDL
jgi:succinyl-CoA synthetase alpha subunit